MNTYLCAGPGIIEEPQIHYVVSQPSLAFSDPEVDGQVFPSLDKKELDVVTQVGISIGKSEKFNAHPSFPLRGRDLHLSSTTVRAFLKSERD